MGPAIAIFISFIVPAGVGFFVGFDLGTAPVYGNQWSAAERVCEPNEGVKSVEPADEFGGVFDVQCMNKAEFKGMKP